MQGSFFDVYAVSYTHLLKEAKRMLAQCDITEEHREWMAINPRMLGIDLSAGDIAEEDVFFAFRGYRMNYYAITAILARVYFWNGEYELAYNEAKEVLDATYDDDGQKCFSFIDVYKRQLFLLT